LTITRWKVEAISRRTNN